MTSPPLFQISCLSLLIVIVISRVSTSSAVDNEQFTNCSQPFSCATIQKLTYPFWGGSRPEYCGHPSFQLNCKGDAPLITIQSRVYRVLSVDAAAAVAPTLTVVRDEFWGNPCPTSIYSATLDAVHFTYASNSQNLTLFYGCQTLTSLLVPNQFPCNTNATNTLSYYLTSTTPTLVSPLNTSTLTKCTSSVIVRVKQTAAAALASNPPSISIKQALDAGFGLQWEANNANCTLCVRSGGLCGSNSNSFICYCSDRPYPATCGSPQLNGSASAGSNSSHKAKGTSTGLYAAGAVIAGVGLGWVIFAFVQRRKHRAAKSVDAETKDLSFSAISKGLTTTASTSFSRSIRSFPSSNTEFGKASTYFGIQVFNYIELEEATDNFNPARELGNGGFGTVYYGQLQDGRIVAVKRLYENNFKRVEQFMNEVEILTRLRHDNLVILYGCTSRRSRELLLVYEYVPNGTVADHLHGRRVNSGLLSWPIRLSIAVETADALAYLHKSDIVHRDVKTNNILLDKTFRVKVADFGLSRLFPTDVTHVSTAPQGTPGYVDPEYYQCYQLTEKSDVYSFGVVLIELISSKQAVDTNRDRHDINLSNMAISKIQNHALRELVDPSLGFETNSSTRRMITLVAELAFRCLQMEKDMRPSMEEVLEVLRGIQNEELNAQKPEVLDIVVEDEVGLLKGNSSPKSTDSVGA